MKRINVIWKRISRFCTKISDDQVWQYSAQAGFYIIMSFFPFVMFLLTLLQFLPFTRSQLVDVLEMLIPSAVSRYIIPIIDEVYETSTGAILSLTIVVTLWTASRGIVAIKDGLNRVKRINEKRNALLMRIKCILYIILFALSIILLLAFYVFGKQIAVRLETVFPALSGLLGSLLSVRMTVSVSFLTLIFMIIYKVLPDKKSSLVKELPGAVVAAFGWVFFSLLFSYYIDNLSNMTATYGSLTTIVLCMIWLLFCMFILLMGEELNCVVNGERVKVYLKNKLLRKRKKVENSDMKTSLVFTGDIGFDKYMDGRWSDEGLVSEEVMKFLHNCDYLTINVEGPLSAGKKNGTDKGVGQLIHSMNPDAAKFFRKIGADIWNICNNHIMDAGPEGMADTLKLAAENGVKTLGAGMNIEEAARPVIIERAGGIGMIGVGYQRACRKAGKDTPGCFSWSDMERIKAAIYEIKKTCRWCIVVAHGGEEFTALPSPYVRKRYMDYLDMGADIVISHHPHVPMNYETFPGKAIFYSLGNFIFDTDYQRSQFNTEKGVLIRLDFTEEEFTFEPFGIRIDRENERIVADALPDIFVDVRQDEYEKLAPLAAKVLVENTKRQLRYLNPDKFLNAGQEEFYANFYEPMRSGRVPGEVLDFQLIYPLSLEAEKGMWNESRLENVKKYMLDQLEK